VALFAGVLYVAGAGPSVVIVLGALLVTLLFTIAAQAARARLAAAWLATSVIGFALFLGFTFGVLLPHLQTGWPATRIAEAIAPLEHCVVGRVGVVGLREPSTNFLLGPNSEVGAQTVAEWMTGGEDGIAVVEDRWHGDLTAALDHRGGTLPKRMGCVRAFNVMRGCPLAFSIYVTGAPRLDPECKVPARFACKDLPQTAVQAGSRCR
jgi:hypothetical protein